MEKKEKVKYLMIEYHDALLPLADDEIEQYHKAVDKLTEDTLEKIIKVMKDKRYT